METWCTVALAQNLKKINIDYLNVFDLPKFTIFQPVIKLVCIIQSAYQTVCADQSELMLFVLGG